MRRSVLITVACLAVAACDRKPLPKAGDLQGEVAALVPKVEEASGLTFKQPPKVASQTQELDLAERELKEMKQELKMAAVGAPPPPSAQEQAERELEDALGDAGAAKTRQEIDALVRERRRADVDAEAQSKLDELKKKMGK